MMTVLLKDLVLFVMDSLIPKRICLLPLHIKYARTISQVFWYLRSKLQSLLLSKIKSPFFNRLRRQLNLLRMRNQRIQVLVCLLLPLINSNKCRINGLNNSPGLRHYSPGATFSLPQNLLSSMCLPMLPFRHSFYSPFCPAHRSGGVPGRR